jgi:starch synthase
MIKASLSILFATSEMAPWVKTGGLGDVAAALPVALRRAGHDVRVLLPFYPALQQAFPQAEQIAVLPPLAPATAGQPPAGRRKRWPALAAARLPELYQRPGNPYLAADGHDWPDNASRFGLLSRVAALLGQAASPLAWRPDVIHTNDWQTALAPAWLHYEGGAASVVTVHNIAFQGCFPAAGAGRTRPARGSLALRWRRVPRPALLPQGRPATGLADFHGQPDLRPRNPGRGIRLRPRPLLRHRRDQLRGILNGVDTRNLESGHRSGPGRPYAANRLAAKRANKLALQREMGLAEHADRPLFGVISRLTAQKGLDLLLTIGDGIPHLPAQLAVLGSGDKAMEAGFLALAERHPGQIAVSLKFDEGLAHRIEAGADCFLMPSRFEPCGLNQMYSLRYGTPPLVQATGGLADTVVDVKRATLADKTANGFVMADGSAHALWQAMERATATWQDRRLWQRIQQNGMRRDFSWSHAAAEYSQLYRDASPPT